MSITGRFGVEIEINALDGRDFVLNPLVAGEKPAGITEISRIISDSGKRCEVQDWGYNHGASSWVCKPDSSCGIEICSPVMESTGLQELSSVLKNLRDSGLFCADKRCSLHVHLELSTMECDDDVGAVLAWWLKCEHVFLDSVPQDRKNNKYCRPVGLTDLFDPDEVVCAKTLFKKLSFKHLSVNTFHVSARRRPSIEFRIAEGGCDPEFATMWVRTLLGFARSAQATGLPRDYKWASPKQVLDFLKLDSEVMNWFLKRLSKNCLFDSSEVFSRTIRSHALEVYDEWQSAEL